MNSLSNYWWMVYYVWISQSRIVTWFASYHDHMAWGFRSSRYLMSTTERLIRHMIYPYTCGRILYIIIFNAEEVFRWGNPYEIWRLGSIRSYLFLLKIGRRYLSSFHILLHSHCSFYLICLGRCLMLNALFNILRGHTRSCPYYSERK